MRTENTEESCLESIGYGPGIGEIYVRRKVRYQNNPITLLKLVDLLEKEKLSLLSPEECARLYLLYPPSRLHFHHGGPITTTTASLSVPNDLDVYVIRNSPIFNRQIAQKMVESHSNGQEYCPERSFIEEIKETAFDDLDKEPEERNVFTYRGEEKFSVKKERLGKVDLGRFLFRKYTGIFGALVEKGNGPKEFEFSFYDEEDRRKISTPLLRCNTINPHRYVFWDLGSLEGFPHLGYHNKGHTFEPMFASKARGVVKVAKEARAAALIGKDIFLDLLPGYRKRQAIKKFNRWMEAFDKMNQKQ